MITRWLKKVNLGQLLLLISLLISVRILILDEEVLVLVCFIILVLILRNKIGSYINDELVNRSKKTFSELQISYRDYSMHISTILTTLTVGQKVSDQLGYLLRFNNQVIITLFDKLVSDIYIFIQLFFKAVLTFITSLEMETTYLLRVLLCLELDKIVKINCDLINSDFLLSF
uniref:Uncharacterized protein ORF172 n=1 Tax=Cyanidium caldarium TaxID=2771 RepID=Q36343_CYACA|nr:unknown [Cyanidium caldarium]